jgi:hypothetical protein
VDPTNTKHVEGDASMRRVSGRRWSPEIVRRGRRCSSTAERPPDERREADTYLLEPAFGWLRWVRPRRQENRCHHPSRPLHSPESRLASKCTGSSGGYRGHGHAIAWGSGAAAASEGLLGLGEAGFGTAQYVHGRVGSWLVGSTGEKIRSHRKWAGLIFLGLFVNWIMDNASSSQHIYVYLNKILQRIRKGLLSMYSYRDVLLVVRSTPCRSYEV